MPRNVRVGFLEEVTADGAVSQGGEVPGTKDGRLEESFLGIRHPRGPPGAAAVPGPDGACPKARPGSQFPQEAPGCRPQSEDGPPGREPHRQSQKGLRGEGPAGPGPEAPSAQRTGASSTKRGLPWLLGGFHFIAEQAAGAGGCTQGAMRAPQKAKGVVRAGSGAGRGVRDGRWGERRCGQGGCTEPSAARGGGGLHGRRPREGRARAGTWRGACTPRVGSGRGGEPDPGRPLPPAQAHPPRDRPRAGRGGPVSAPQCLGGEGSRLCSGTPLAAPPCAPPSVRSARAPVRRGPRGRTCRAHAPASTGRS